VSVAAKCAGKSALSGLTTASSLVAFRPARQSATPRAGALDPGHFIDVSAVVRRITAAPIAGLGLA
jgi:hypothetical protein